MSQGLHDLEDRDELESLPPRERFLRAKADHFLRKAEECIQMARFTAARHYIGRAEELNPENAGGKALQSIIDQHLFETQHRGNGVSNGSGTNGTKRRRSELVLLVDQDEQLLTGMGEALRKYGFQVLGAINYDEAVETMSLITPDVVVSEVNFENGPRGFDLFQWMKNNLTSRSIPFLFLASRIDRDTLIAGKRFGVDDFLQKPVDEGVVSASILNCLARRRPALLSA
jgi:PleD family two-component response regulator